ncbi:hypothetical protein FVE85_0480 [Porphyridium purpureum]|uniref:Nuclease associated modular domain-containing protein n=1 Tax=Porphyridium purpureum TaxID=35688 RepID=A0A5J4YYR2_PORPP|nr:hypothetical protein FVE85_0480 [Porphyridium purpureum]|eukprot:POR7231..scf208_2
MRFVEGGEGGEEEGAGGRTEGRWGWVDGEDGGVVVRCGGTQRRRASRAEQVAPLRASVAAAVQPSARGRSAVAPASASAAAAGSETGAQASRAAVVPDVPAAARDGHDHKLASSKRVGGKKAASESTQHAARGASSGVESKRGAEGQRRLRELQQEGSETLELEHLDDQMHAPKLPVWLGRKHKEESKAKIGRANKGKVPWNKGLKHSEETRQKIAASTRAAMAKGKVRDKLASAAKGKRHSEETRAKIKASLARRRREIEIVKGVAPSLKTGREAALSLALKNGLKSKIGAVPEDLLLPRNGLRRRKQTNTGSRVTAFHWAPEVCETVRADLQRMWSDPKLRRELNAPVVRKESRTADEGSSSGLWRSTPMKEETKKKLSERIKAMWADPEYRERVAKGLAERKMREEHLKRNDPLYRQSKLLSESHREKIRQSLRRKHRERQAELESSGVSEKSRAPQRRSAHESRDLNGRLNDGRRVSQGSGGRRLKGKTDSEVIDAVTFFRDNSAEEQNFVESLQASGILPPLGDGEMSARAVPLTGGPEEVSAQIMENDMSGSHTDILNGLDVDLDIYDSQAEQEKLVASEDNSASPTIRTEQENVPAVDGIDVGPRIEAEEDEGIEYVSESEYETDEDDWDSESDSDLEHADFVLAELRLSFARNDAH